MELGGIEGGCRAMGPEANGGTVEGGTAEGTDVEVSGGGGGIGGR